MTSNDGEVLQGISSLLRDHLNLAPPSADYDLLATGLLDSLAFVTLLLGLERRFGLSIDFNELDLDDFRTMSSIAAYVVERGTWLGRQVEVDEGPMSAPRPVDALGAS